MGTIPEILAAWRKQADEAGANAVHCDNLSRAAGRHRTYLAQALALRSCAEQLEAWWQANVVDVPESTANCDNRQDGGTP